MSCCWLPLLNKTNVLFGSDLNLEIEADMDNSTGKMTILRLELNRAGQKTVVTMIKLVSAVHGIQP